MLAPTQIGLCAVLDRCRRRTALYMVPGAGLEPARPQWPGDFKFPSLRDNPT